jgi:phage-related protein
MVLEVRFYATSKGVEPVRDWLRGLVPESRKIIGDDIKTVQFGWPLGMPLVRNMTDGMWEVRSNLPGGIARVLFMTHGPQMVLLHGFVKKTRGTPNQDLALARTRMREVQHG